MLTDGHDNMSVKFDRSTISRIFQAPGSYAKSELGCSKGSVFTHFYATCISVGSSAASNFEFIEALRRPNIRHMRASDARGIRNCFQVVKTQIESIRLTTRQFKAVIEDIVTSHRVSGGGNRVQSVFEGMNMKKGKKKSGP